MTKVRLLEGSFTRRGLSGAVVGILIALDFVTGVVAGSLSLFNPDPEAPVSVYNAGVSITVS
jgi:hypothetical protein